jgi:hypothetical protein
MGTGFTIFILAKVEIADLLARENGARHPMKIDGSGQKAIGSDGNSVRFSDRGFWQEVRYHLGDVQEAA